MHWTRASKLLNEKMVHLDGLLSAEFGPPFASCTLIGGSAFLSAPISTRSVRVAVVMSCTAPITTCGEIPSVEAESAAFALARG